MMRVALVLWVLIALGCQGSGSSPSSPSGTGHVPSVSPPVGVSPSTAPAESTVTLTGPTEPVTVGREIRLDLTIQEARQLYAVDLALAYDTALLTYVGQAEGNLLNRDGAPTVVEVAEAEEDPGHLLVGVTRLGDVGGASGSGVLVTLVFQARQMGQASVQVDQATATLRDADDTPMTVANWQGVMLTVR